ncbi:tetratricopeptide repeat-containing sensor histidine kinase [Winogradskyella sp.]|uniref:tetratricopeptide repeat-containing sensor histidine kinase n=1 Tax=Winogradskyella sp. TaxID=1883156 RepID=UPI002624FD93|nr:tetratricopeptide repeat-containing sensor histidine kinase [Winogradskyella sp.]
MKLNLLRLVNFLAKLCVLVVSCYLSCYSQERELPFSEEFRSDILKACSTCQKQNKYTSDRLSKHRFHNAHVYFSRGELDSSYVLITQINENRKAEDSNRKLYVLLTLKGIIFDEKKLYDDALKSLKEAIDIGNEENFSSVNNLYALLGQIYIEQRKFKQGIEWLEKWKGGLKTEDKRKSINIHNLGVSYLHIKDYENAEKNLLLGYQLNKKFKDTLGLARSSLDIANLYYSQYKDSIAISFFEKGLAFAKRANDLNILQNAYLNLAVVNENANDFKSAIQYRKAYEKIHDSIWNRDRIWQLAQKDKEIALAASEEVLRSEIEKKRLYRIIGLILLLALLIGSFFSFKIIKQKKLISNLNDTKDKLFSILTHDLKTPIHHIKTKLFQILSSHSKESSNSNEAKQLIEESYQLSERTSLLINNTLHWVLENKNQLLFVPQKLDLSVITNHVLYDHLPLIKKKSISLNKSMKALGHIYADPNSIKIIIRNLLDNAIKFTPKEGNISLSTKIKGDHILLSIKDNGQGFNVQNLNSSGSAIRHSSIGTDGETGTGLGLKLCRELAIKNNGEFIIESTIGKGTTATIEFPQYK